MVKSFSDIPYTVSFKNYSSKLMKTNFSSPSLKIPPSGWNTTQLTLKAEWKPGLNPSVTETIPIEARINRSQLTEGKYFSFENKNLSISRPAG